MANRYFTQFFYSFFKKPVIIAGKISLNASAAVTSSSIKGVESVVKTGTGLYTITLQDKYVELVSISDAVVDTAQNLVIAFASVNLPAKTLVLQTKVAGTIADVSDACDIYVNLVFNDSSV